MFRLVKEPEDPSFPADLEKLGYIVNDDDQIRQIIDPERTFQYYMNKNERILKKRQAAIKVIIYEHIAKRGLIRQNLPLDPTDDGRHVPILISADLHSYDRVIVVINDRYQDLGVWAWRRIGGKGAGSGIKHGTIISMLDHFEAEAEKHKSDPEYKRPGFLIANPGELFWWRGGQKAITRRNWETIPRVSAFHPSLRLDPVKNVVPGHEDAYAHAQYIFNTALPALVKPEAQLQIVSLSDSTVSVIDSLNKHWPSISNRLTGVVWIAPGHTASDFGENSELRHYLKLNSRAYVCSTSVEYGEEVKPEDIYDTLLGCDVFSADEEIDECVMPRVMTLVADYLEDLHLKKAKYADADV
ncbi:MAG: hypothetical protein M1814_005643 [Vezdaea aestivalis]|nr:MAG: hypothetical protein M1814_005643 [Vezdaea aestivalis]